MTPADKLAEAARNLLHVRSLIGTEICKDLLAAYLEYEASKKKEPACPGFRLPPQKSKCERCGGAGWVWDYELDDPPEQQTDQRYLCPDCHSEGVKDHGEQ